MCPEKHLVRAETGFESMPVAQVALTRESTCVLNEPPEAVAFMEESR